MQEAIAYPFSAIVSLNDLKLALVLNAIDPKIGGLLIQGPKGSGKTTVVRALAEILPQIKIVSNCPFNCNPEDPSNMCEKCLNLYIKKGELPFEERRMKVVDLPLGATEDRVVGSLDIEKVIKMGVEALEPGILAQSNQNILYVDEVNLLPDHIADDLLDAAATGWTIIEREGISVKHPSRFIFIGTMNPEEGHLRPQLLDRFPLSVEVKRITDAKDRIEIVKRNMEFEVSPKAFVEKYRAYQEELKNRIIQARKNLSKIEISDKIIEAICKACLELKVDGMRPDIVIAKSARTLAAFENKSEVSPEHVIKAAELTLSHRTREGGFLEPATPREIKEAMIAELTEIDFSEDKDKSRRKSTGKKEKKKQASSKDEKKAFSFPIGLRRIGNRKQDVGKAKTDQGPVPESFLAGTKDLNGEHFLFDSNPEKGGKKAVFTSKSKWSLPKLSKGVRFLSKIRESRFLPFKLFFQTKKVARHAARSVGKRAVAITTFHRGRARGWKIPNEKPRDIHMPATIRAAARMHRSRQASPGISLAINSEDIREKLRIYKAPMTIMFVLDLSESMLHSIGDVKEAMLKLHRDAYRYRDKAGIVALKEMGAAVVQHPTTNLKLVANKLLRLRMSGFTPLAAGMLRALDVLKEAKRRDVSTIPVMVIITDGETNVPLRKDLQTGEIREFNFFDVSFFRHEDEAIKDVVSVSEMIKREGIKTVVINTTPTPTDLLATSGSITTRLIAAITNGMLHETSGKMFKHKRERSEEISSVISQTRRQIAQGPIKMLRVR